MGQRDGAGAALFPRRERSNGNRAELFWIAKNGIKMTGMPSWRNAMSDRQIWDVVAFLEASRQLDSQAYVPMAGGAACAGGVKGPWPSPGPLSIPRP